MIGINNVKDYLRIPQEDTSEDSFLGQIIEMGYDYLDGSIDDFQTKYDGNEAFSRKADYWVQTAWCPQAYDNREGMMSGGVEMGYASRSLLMQLQTYKVVSE